MAEVKTVLSKYTELIDYAIYHAPLLRNHKEFGEKMRDIRFEIGELEEGYKRIVLAANGRGMVSEMLNMQEAVILVCGLHDKVLLLEAKILEMIELSKINEFIKENGLCTVCAGTGDLWNGDPEQDAPICKHCNGMGLEPLYLQGDTRTWICSLNHRELIDKGFDVCPECNEDTADELDDEVTL